MQRSRVVVQYQERWTAGNRAVESAELVFCLDTAHSLTDGELAEAIDRLVVETASQGPKDMGKVMAALAVSYKGRYDGRKASEAVRARLSS
jgi:uncharacterized protein YqeY